MLLDFLRKAIPSSRGEPEAAYTPEPRKRSALDVVGVIARMEGQPLPPAILVPIHNAPAEVDDCIAALIAHTPAECRILLLEDASPDPAVDAVLSTYERHAKVEIHRNAKNLGFTRTVNLGIDLAEGADVVLLNSDTKVTPRWLENLKLAAYSSDRVATATALSNNAGAFSVPEFNRENLLPGWLELDDYARLVTRSSARLYPQVPTGNAFCMYIRRDCLDQVGAFDAEAFPRGYGEENDFCMRAGRLGWTHVIDDATLIYHVRTASFGDEKNGLLKRSRAVLDQRYPDYAALARGFEHNPDLRSARETISSALSRSRASGEHIEPRTLVVAGSGATVSNGSSFSLASHASGGETIRLRRTSAGLELHATSATGEERLLDIATLPDTEPDRAGDARYEEVVADWLVQHAIETVRMPAAAPYQMTLQKVCERLNIPARQC